jgi:chemotaxis protein histidine kinase CheA
MDLKGIIAIAGKPGLYKVVGQGKNTLIVESLIDRKRMPAHSNNKISSLEDITIYTTGEEDARLEDVITTMADKLKGEAAISQKEDIGKLKKSLLEYLPDYDEGRVYNSDVQKLFQWYNLLQSSGELKERIENAAAEAAEAAKAEEKEKKPTKAAKSAEDKPVEGEKKAASKKAAPKTPAKPANSKVAAKPKSTATNSKAAAAPKKTGKGKV